MLSRFSWKLACAWLGLIPTCCLASSGTEQAGDVLSVLMPLSAYGYTLYVHDRTGQIQFHKSFLTVLAATQALKFGIHKERPDGSNDRSFPSGHTSSAFQAAGFVNKRYGWQWGMPSYLAASYVGYSRVYAKKHYVEDVMAGAVIGMGASTWLTSGKPGVNVFPQVSKDGVMFSLTTLF